MFDAHYIDHRIKSTQFPGNHRHLLGVPLMQPIGGHAVYVAAKRLYPKLPVVRYPGQALFCALYELAGIRCVEIGSLMFGTYDAASAWVPAATERVHPAIPRRVYPQSHIEYVAETFESVLAQRARGVRIVSEPRFLRPLSAHVSAHFAPIARGASGARPRRVGFRVLLASAAPLRSPLSATDDRSQCSSVRGAPPALPHADPTDPPRDARGDHDRNAVPRRGAP